MQCLAHLAYKKTVLGSSCSSSAASVCTESPDLFLQFRGVEGRFIVNPKNLVCVNISKISLFQSEYTSYLPYMHFG